MSPEEIKKANKGELILECSRIILTRSSGPHPHLLDGPGQIEQADGGGWAITIHCSPDPHLAHDSIHYSAQAGELFKKDELFQMRATDYCHRIWQADGAILMSAGSFFEQPFVAKAHSRAITTKQTYKDCCFAEDMVELHLSRIPFIRFDKVSTTNVLVDGEELHQSSILNRMSVEIEGYSCEFAEEEGVLKMIISGEPGSFHDYTYLRAMDALCFASGRNIDIRMRSEHIGSERIAYYYSPVERVAREKKVGAPADPCKWETSLAFWNIFKAFFAVVGSHRGELWHPLSAINQFVLDSGGVSITTASLIRAVAIEAMVQWLWSQRRGEFSVVAADDIEVLKDCLGGCPVEDPVKRRAVGLLDSLSQPRPLDFLKDIRDKGLITDAMIERWRSVRPMSAHGSVMLKDKRLIGQVVQDSDVLLALYYRLVLTAIGYKGPVSDYSILGWPTVEFPSFRED